MGQRTPSTGAGLSQSMPKERAFAAVRRAAGMDENCACLRLGCSLSSLRAWERSRKPLSITTARKMAAVYGVSLDELFIHPAGAGGQGTGERLSGNGLSPSGTERQGAVCQ